MKKPTAITCRFPTGLTNSPVVELNRAVAVAEAQGPEAGLDIVDRLPLERRLAELDAAAGPDRP